MHSNGYLLALINLAVPFHLATISSMGLSVSLMFSLAATSLRHAADKDDQTLAEKINRWN